MHVNSSHNNTAVSRGLFEPAESMKGCWELTDWKMWRIRPQNSPQNQYKGRGCYSVLLCVTEPLKLCPPATCLCYRKYKLPSQLNIGSICSGDKYKYFVLNGRGSHDSSNCCNFDKSFSALGRQWANTKPVT